MTTDPGTMQMTRARRSQGFGLLEVLVTLAILTFGMVGVATLHGVMTRQSGDNRARAEAMLIAQSRIEEMRNYTNLAATPDEFDLLYPAGGGFGNSLQVAGVNAVFTRTENITNLVSGKQVSVNVAWAGADGSAENVVVTTELVYLPPRRVADAARTATPALVNAPVGRAVLGEGQVPQDAVTTPNDDGTALLEDDSDDLKLVVDDQVVLSLLQACQTDDGTCLDFVRIKGRVWIDTAAQSVAPGEVFVVASDAAYCARYYTQGGTVHRVTATTTTVPVTSGGDYKYFDYTCYLGGGWHGNIGIVLAGGVSQRDRICVGDPTSLNAWERPVLAARRAYRGLLYRIDPSREDGREKVAGTDLVRFYSHGIIDQAQLPRSGEGSHDFVVTDMPPSETSDSACVSRGAMVRADAAVGGVAGGLFDGVPTDFVCLNDGLLDHYDTTRFGHDESCFYDPTDPPIDRHVISGTLQVSGAQSATNENIVRAMGLVTSDGPGNCSVEPPAYQLNAYRAAFSCDVFDWGGGWNGYIELVFVNLTCATSSQSFSTVRMDSAGNDFSCSVTGAPGPDPDPDPDPGAGSYVLFSGIVTTDSANNRELAAVTISGGGTCALAADGKSYTCSTAAFTGTWSGTLTFTADATVCTGRRVGSNPAQFGYNGLAAGTVIRNVTLKNNSNQCP